MEAQKIYGIVVSVVKYKDFDALCSILTENGIKKIKFTGARRPNAKMAYAAQPFFCGEFLLSGAKDYAVVTQVNQTKDFYSLTANYDAFVLGSNMLKISQKIATNDTEELLNLVLICLCSLQIQGIEIISVENFFLTNTLKYLGIWNRGFNCSACSKPISDGAIINVESGAIYCKNCAKESGIALSKNICEYLDECTNSTLSQLLLSNASIGVKQRTNEILNKIIENQT